MPEQDRAKRLIQETIRKPNFDQEIKVQPSVLMNRNINHDNVASYTSCHVNDSWEKFLAVLMASGWVVFRIQTEFKTIGHVTMAYLAKPKKGQKL